MKIHKEQIINGVIVGIVAGITMFVLSGAFMLGARMAFSHGYDRDWGDSRMMGKMRGGDYGAGNYGNMMDTREAGDPTPIDPTEAAAQ